MSDSRTQQYSQQLAIWDSAEKLISPDPFDREQGLSYLNDQGSFKDSPLAAYLLATRSTDENIEIRFHSVQILGKLLDFDASPGDCISGAALKYVHGFFCQINKDQMVRLLEVGVSYLAAENDLLNIFKLSSYAGDLLSGIVNDRKIPTSIRQQAIFFGSETGYLEMISVFQNLILRIDKNRERAGRNLTKKLLKDEDAIYSSAVVALGKLTSGNRTEGY